MKQSTYDALIFILCLTAIVAWTCAPYYVLCYIFSFPDLVGGITGFVGFILGIWVFVKMQQEL